MCGKGNVMLGEGRRQCQGRADVALAVEGSGANCVLLAGKQAGPVLWTREQVLVQYESIWFASAKEREQQAPGRRGWCPLLPLRCAE